MYLGGYLGFGGGTIDTGGGSTPPPTPVVSTVVVAQATDIDREDHVQDAIDRLTSQFREKVTV